MGRAAPLVGPVRHPAVHGLFLPVQPHPQAVGGERTIYVSPRPPAAPAGRSAGAGAEVQRPGPVVAALARRGPDDCPPLDQGDAPVLSDHPRRHDFVPLLRLLHEPALERPERHRLRRLPPHHRHLIPDVERGLCLTLALLSGLQTANDVRQPVRLGHGRDRHGPGPWGRRSFPTRKRAARSC